MNKVKITNSKQFEMLVLFMEKNLPLAMGSRKMTKMDIQKGWDTIAATLNSFGPPERDGESWQKVWTDMKFNIKKKVIHNNSETEGVLKQRTPYILSSLQESVAALLGYDQLGTGNGVAQYEPTATTTTTATVPPYIPQSRSASPSTNFEFASTSMTSNADDINIEFIEGINTDDEQLLQNHSSNEKISYRHKKHTVREKLLRKQTDIQTSLYKEISHHLKETQRYQRQRYELEEERLRLYKIELERNEKHRLEENKLRLMQIELKKRRLELEERKLEMLDTDDDDKPLSATQKRRRKRQ